MLKKTVLFIIAAIFSLFAAAGCGDLPNKPGVTPTTPIEEGEPWEERDMLHGMCYSLSERVYEGSNANLELEVQLMANMGVKTVRNWLHITQMLEDPLRVNRAAADAMHELLALQKEKGLIPIGMSHTNFNSGTAISGKPARDITTGSEYIKWLNNYYLSWKTLAAEFPEIMFWEIDNEINNHDFMKNTKGEAVYTHEQMAAIATDMLFYASKAIHEVNPKAKTVMGGLTEVTGLGEGLNKVFLQMIYDNIKSGEYGYLYGMQSKSAASTNPDDYFQIACWHPYVHSRGYNDEDFVRYNDEIYQVILDNEGKDKPVFFTEIGFSNARYTEEQAADIIERMFATVRTRMTYVKTINYFKLFDVAKPTWTGSYSRYGLFYDPDPTREYTAVVGPDTVSRLTPGAPKLQAYAFQRSSGGKGSLELVKYTG